LIKAVYFDWFNTLATYDPPREELYQKVLLEYKIDLPLKTIYKGLQLGDRFFFSESGRALMKGKSPSEKLREYVRYVQAVGDEGGFSFPIEEQLEIMPKVLKGFTGTFKLFAEVLPLFRELKQKQYILGIISNADQTLDTQINRTGLNQYLDVLVTSDLVGVEKPAAPIFLAALTKTRMEASNSIYIGDQYQSDILGALNAGMQAVLVDRYDINSDITGCPRIRSLEKIVKYL
jgi:putative hydrolase of the HAD superfamily